MEQLVTRDKKLVLHDAEFETYIYRDEVTAYKYSGELHLRLERSDMSSQRLESVRQVMEMSGKQAKLAGIPIPLFTRSDFGL